MKGGRDSTRGPSIPTQVSGINAPIAVVVAYRVDLDVPLRDLRMENRASESAGT